MTKPRFGTVTPAERESIRKRHAFKSTMHVAEAALRELINDHGETFNDTEYASLFGAHVVLSIRIDKPQIKVKP